MAHFKIFQCSASFWVGQPWK